MKIKPSTLLHSQIELLRTGFLNSRRNWVICAPTGAGKTRMAEWALQQCAEQDRRGVFIAPLKAIVEEKASDWAKRYPDLKIGLYTGETGRTGTRSRPHDEPFLLMTPEKLASFLHGWKRHIDWLAEIDLVVLDEFHLLGDTSRGATLESLIGRLQRTNPFVRFIGLSATIPNAQEMGDWLDAEVFVTAWRPVPLSHRIVRFRKATEKPRLLEREIEETVARNGQVLVFVNSRRRSEQLSRHLQESGWRTAFYHAGLDINRRTERQQAMRHHHLDALISTSSLEMGVNFPARKVVVYDSYVFNGTRFGPLPVGRYLQAAGRAGRPGLDPVGESVLFLPKWHKEGEAYTSGMPEPVTSGLKTYRHLQKEILTEVATRLSISESHLDTNFIERTFRRFSEGTIHLAPQLDILLKSGLIKRTGDSDRYLTGTPLGQIATQMDVCPETIRILDRFYFQVPGPTLFDCLLALCLCSEMSPKLPFNFEQIDEMADLVLDTPSHLLDAVPEVMGSLVPGRLPTKTLLAALKSAAVLMVHTTGETLGSLAERFDCYPMDLKILKKNCDWLLTTALRVFAYRWHQDWESENPDGSDLQRPLSTHEKQVQLLIPMIRYGIPQNACRLVAIKGIGPRRALALVRSGVGTLSALHAAPLEMLSGILGLRPDLCRPFQISAHKMVAEEAKVLPFDLSEEPSPIPFHNSRVDWPKGVDPYRLRRALDLQITHRFEECLRVEGGTEPHTIQMEIANGSRTYCCDCMDAAKGHLCKHVMRARLEYGDGGELLTALRAFQEKRDNPLRYALADLWVQGAALYDRYEERAGDDGKRFLDRAAAARRWRR